MKESAATILVNSCDAYEDAWYPFFELLKKYWVDCNYPIVLNTESKIYKDDVLNLKCFGLYSPETRVTYGQRMIQHLKRIPSDFIIMMMDDFFLRSPVDNEKIAFYIDYMKKNGNVAYISFDAVKDSYNIDDKSLNECVLRPRCGEYKVNLQAGIWRKEKLLSCIRSHESPWEFETKGSIRSFEMQDKFYTMKDISLSPIDYGKRPGLTWGIVRGKWVKEDVVPLFEKNNIIVNTQYRGYFNKSDFEDITIQKGGLIRDIKSYGISLVIQMKRWHIERFIRKMMHLQYDVDWVAYKRRKEQENHE